MLSNHYTQEASIRKNIKLVKNLLKKYDIQDSNLHKAISDVEDKLNNPNLYLSVIGEFSSGKSTFINALIRENLLESEARPGTTIINTLIRYSESYNIIFKYSNGEIFNLKEKTRKTLKLSDIKDYVKKFTVKSERSKDIREVIIELPSEFLKSGIVIVDTPGTNSNEKWHEEVTKNALQNISDTSLILTTASQPLQDTLVTYIKENMSDVLDHSIFVVTKTDMIRERERDRLFLYIKQKIFKEFSIEAPTILPYTPLYVLGESDSDVKQSYEECKPNNYDRLLAESYNSEQEIYLYITEHKLMIQAEKAERILRKTLLSISEEMEKLQISNRQQLDLLMKHKIRNLSDFIEEKKSIYLSEYADNRVECVVDGVWDTVNSIAEEQFSSLQDKLWDCQDNKEIEKFCKRELNYEMERNANILIDAGMQKVMELYEYAHYIIDKFQQDFEKTYDDLKALTTDETDDGYSINTDIQKADVNNIKDMLKNVETKDVMASTIGLAVGSLIGSFIFPGIGTYIGAVAGKLLGQIFAPDLNDIKNEIWQKLAPILQENFDKINDYLISELQRCDEEAYNQIDDYITDHLQVYSEYVNERIKECEETENQINTQLMELEKDKSILAFQLDM